MIQIPNLEIDRDGDGPDDQILLRQDFGGNVEMVTLHPCQVKLLAERMGLLAPDAEAQRAIARLGRQMRVLLDRIDELDDLIKAAAARGHEDLELEMTFSFATWELAREFVADLPPATPPATGTATPATAAQTPARTPAPVVDRTAAQRQKRHRERQKQRRNGSTVTPVTAQDRNATPALFEEATAA